MFAAGASFAAAFAAGLTLRARGADGESKPAIAGWDEAFRSMKKGEKRTLIVPHWLAYGEKGRPPKIPPKATLVFDVELLDWR